MKRLWRTIIILLSIFALGAGTETAKAGPFAEFFRKLRRSITQPEQKSRPHRSSRKQKPEGESSDASENRTSSGAVVAPPDGNNTRVARATAATKAEKSDLRYGIPVPGKQGFVTSPFAPESGYVDVRGFPPGTQVKDPYTGKMFLTP